MDDKTGFDTATRIAAGDDGTAYDGVAIALHWATAALVIANFALSQVWDWFAKPTRGLLEDTHMSFGVLLSAVILTRLVWRWIPGHQLSSLDAGWVRLASKATHYLLYALLVAEAALGFSFRWGVGRPMAFFGAALPSPVGQAMGRPMAHQLREFHEWIGWTIVVIALLHALAALYHHYLLKDRVLERMLPSARRA